MADQTSTGVPQNSGTVQNNDSTTVQQQDQSSLPGTTPTTALQPSDNGLNTLKSSSLAVKSGPPATKSAKRASGTLLSIILVVVILAIAAGLFLASLRVKDEPKPTVAVGAEDNGAMGKVSKKKFRRNKKK